MPVGAHRPLGRNRLGRTYAFGPPALFPNMKKPWQPLARLASGLPARVPSPKMKKPRQSGLFSSYGAGDGTRTREYQLGKLGPYHLATPAYGACDSIPHHANMSPASFSLLLNGVRNVRCSAPPVSPTKRAIRRNALKYVLFKRESADCSLALSRFTFAASHVTMCASSSDNS